MLDRASVFVDRFWLPVAGACLALALLVGVAAYATQPSVQDFDDVDHVLTDFVTAAGDRNGERACELLTPLGRRAATAAVPGISCPDYARSFGFDVAGLGSVTLNIPRELPDRVVLNASNMTDPAGRPVQRKVLMVRTPDGFRIEGLAR
ncbi:MAG: hypothetical protein JWM31_1977 [Solirubrobacterales bacterium]|nr:hypothetical protein [Solirubrobacterales bacterium]